MALTKIVGDPSAMSRILMTPTLRDFWNQVYAEDVLCESLPFTWRHCEVVRSWFCEEWGIVIPGCPKIGISLSLSFLDWNWGTVLLGVGPEQADALLRKCHQRGLNLDRLPLWCHTDDEVRACLDLAERILSVLKECRDQGRVSLVVNSTD